MSIHCSLQPPAPGADAHQASDVDRLLEPEWLATNGLGGYCSGTVLGACTRRYHGLLVAALPAPVGRCVMLNHLAEVLHLADGRRLRLGAEEIAGQAPLLPELPVEFRLEMGLPVWRYAAGGTVLEKRIFMPSGQNTVHCAYRLLEGEPVQLWLQPSLHFRPHEAAVSAAIGSEYSAVHPDDDSRRLEVRSRSRPDLPALRCFIHGCDPASLSGSASLRGFEYRLERARGYPHTGEVWSPGHWHIGLQPGEECTLVASTDDWDTVLAVAPQAARAAELGRREALLEQAHPALRSGLAAELVFAADQFIVTPAYRQQQRRPAQAQAAPVHTVIAGYHWFTDWGRDTMISLEGLTLLTGRQAEAASILRTFLRYVRDGLIPNMFPEGNDEGLYHTADATLWFFHAVDRYLACTGDESFLAEALPALRSIVEHHQRGTRFGIGVDPADGLLTQGAEGYQLTWMDAKVEGWVVTPRRGKAVELNALYYNLLRLMQRWLSQHGDLEAACEMDARATRLAESFNRRFWNPATGCLFDVVDGAAGDDPAIRPNMLLAIGLPHPVLDPARWPSVLEVATRTLLTPAGLRSLAPGHPDYQPRYDGDLRSRDAAYHQGTVWGWLAGPFAAAWTAQHGHHGPMLQSLRDGLLHQLNQAGMGSISEIFDAQPPHTPRGCIAQAWSVAEAIRITVQAEGQE